jgi:hypothetical protein
MKILTHHEGILEFGHIDNLFVDPVFDGGVCCKITKEKDGVLHIALLRSLKDNVAKLLLADFPE